MTAKTYNIDIIEHRKTGLLIAKSDDLKGFIAHGRDYDDLSNNISAAIRALLEARGETVGRVGPVESNMTPIAFAANRQAYHAETFAA